MSTQRMLRFDQHAYGRPFHAAEVTLSSRDVGTALHGHADFYELMMITAGYGEHLLDAGSQKLRTGDVVLVRPVDRHALRARAGQGMTFINVAFAADAWRSFVDLIRADVDNSWERAELPPIFALHDAQFQVVRALFWSVLSAFHEEPTMASLVKFWADVTEIISGDGTNDDPLAGVGRPDWLTRACTAMRREENLRAGLPRLLELAGVSPAHLSRTVRTHYKITPTGLVTDMRLQHAASLLAATSLAVTTIAQRCGFSSPSYFSKRFHIAHGQSPRQFRIEAQRAFVP